MPAHTGPARTGLLLAATAALVLLAPGVAGAAAAPAALACSAAPASGPVIAEPPWPQLRYDLAAVRRIQQGAGVTVAVLDSGVDDANPQLAGAVEDGGNLLPGTGTGFEDCVGHGTAVASIIAARPLDGAGLVGVAPEATILSIRVSDRVQTENGFVGTGDVATLVSGIEEAVAARPQPAVINLSISTTTDSPALRAAIEAALDADIVVVAAVGNLATQGNPTPYPAAYDGVVGVGAISASGARYERSQFGPYVDIVAPGDGVTAATPRSGHSNAMSGTSFAVPFVAGTAALIRARWPDLSRAEVVQRLLATADPPSGGQPSPDYGYGVVNPLRALTEVVLPPVVVAPAESPAPVVAVVPPGGDGSAALPMRVLVVAGVLLLAAAMVTAIAFVGPAGRRRGWRPGTVDTSPPPDDDATPLFSAPVPRPRLPELGAVPDPVRPRATARR